MTSRGILRLTLDAGLAAYEQAAGPLLGIAAPDMRRCLVEQMVDSVRRVEYVPRLATRTMGPAVADPRNPLFDPLKAAIRATQLGDREEAFWLAFVFVHFGKPLRSGWRLARDVYAGPNPHTPWAWAAVSAAPQAFSAWLATQIPLWKADGVRRGFGNHRKYESLSETGAVVESYVAWVQVHSTHDGRVNAALANGATSTEAFDELYRSMDGVKQFGRMARFDYLTMLSKLGLANIAPGKAYLAGATGPVPGARLLFTGSRSSPHSVADIEEWLIALDAYLNVGQQVLEDSICNWQKSPSSYLWFRG